MTVPRAPFGRTGHDSGRVIFGAAALWAMPVEKAAALLDIALAAGVNHIDTAAAYGESELRLAPWLRSHRDDVFLATKTGERTGDGAQASLERSLPHCILTPVLNRQVNRLIKDFPFSVPDDDEDPVQG